MTDIVSEFISALSAAGCPTDTEILADDKVHRFHIVGDKGGKLNGRYQLAVEGSFGFGWFINSKEGVTHKWFSKTPNMTGLEQSTLKAKIDERRTIAEKARKKAAQEARQKAERIWAAGKPARSDHAYLVKKGVSGEGLREYKGVLMVPAFDDKGISTIQFISGAGEKRFLKDANKKGCYFTIPGDGTVALCEGYATGATIHAATGWTVRVCFDSGNMKECAEPGVVICPDNDRWVFIAGKRPADLTELPPGDDPRWAGEWKELLWNPGHEAASAALKRVGGDGRIIPPRFTSIVTRPTDFNDLQALEGLDAVKAALTESAPCPEEEPPTDFAPMPDDMAGMVYCYDPTDPAEPIETAPFKIMGHNQGIYFFLPRGSKQLVSLSPSSMSKNNLFALAPQEWWQERFGKKKGGIDWDSATNALIKTSQKMGVFKPELMLRGAGVWMDDQRVVVHCGDRLMVDGEKVDPFQLPGRYVYESSEKIFTLDSEALLSQDAIKLRKICELCSWENPLSGALLAGWIVMAPICAALEWRPHIWLTGESQAGKSFVMNRIIMKVLDRIAIKFSGGTSEAGLRQVLGCDGRPVIMDEMETESAKDDATVQGVLMLARKASSGDIIGKGTQDGIGKIYAVNSMFCFSSINPAVKQRADESRISLLSLRRNRAIDAEAQFQDLKAFARETLTAEFSRKLLARTVRNIRAIMKNCETFADAAADVLKDRRAADQIAPMLAGVYSLHSASEINLEAAKKWIKEHDWKLYTTVGELADHDRLYDRLMTSTIQVDTSNKRIQAQLGHVIQVALGYDDGNFGSNEARTALKNMDVKVKDDFVYIRKPSHHITSLLRDTPWINNWAKSLRNVYGVTWTDTAVAFGSTTANAVVIPAERFKRGDRLL